MLARLSSAAASRKRDPSATESAQPTNESGEHTLAGFPRETCRDDVPVALRGGLSIRVPARESGGALAVELDAVGARLWLVAPPKSIERNNQS